MLAYTYLFNLTKFNFLFTLQINNFPLCYVYFKNSSNIFKISDTYKYIYNKTAKIYKNYISNKRWPSNKLQETQAA